MNDGSLFRDPPLVPMSQQTRPACVLVDEGQLSSHGCLNIVESLADIGVVHVVENCNGLDKLGQQLRLQRSARVILGTHRTNDGQQAIQRDLVASRLQVLHHCVPLICAHRLLPAKDCPFDGVDVSGYQHHIVPVCIGPQRLKYPVYWTPDIR